MTRSNVFVSNKARAASASLAVRTVWPFASKSSLRILRPSSSSSTHKIVAAFGMHTSSVSNVNLYLDGVQDEVRAEAKLQLVYTRRSRIALEFASSYLPRPQASVFKGDRTCRLFIVGEHQQPHLNSA